MRRYSWALVAAGVMAAGTAIGSMAATTGPSQATAAARQLPRSTAPVQRRTLAAMVAQAGTLTYRARPDGSPYSVINVARGIYTQLPVAGRRIADGHVLYRVDDRPVVLLHGSIPAYRALAAGATGPDVAELNRALVALGYATRAQLSPRSTFFGSVTVAALDKLQAALGVTESGRLALGEAVFEPTALRVTAVSAQLGGRAQPGQTVMQATSTTRQVQVVLDVSQEAEVAVGNKVSITLPDNRTTPGVISSVGVVATCPASSGASGPGSSSAALGTDTCSSGVSGNTSPTVTVDVTPSVPAATGTWDQAPVQIEITTASVPNALVVPVTALLAQASGGYDVEVADPGARNHLVPVSLGLFDDADGLVQVTASGLTPGQRVVVPAT